MLSKASPCKKLPKKTSDRSTVHMTTKTSTPTSKVPSFDEEAYGSDEDSDEEEEETQSSASYQNRRTVKSVEQIVALEISFTTNPLPNLEEKNRVTVLCNRASECCATICFYLKRVLSSITTGSGFI